MEETHPCQEIEDGLTGDPITAPAGRPRSPDLEVGLISTTGRGGIPKDLISSTGSGIIKNMKTAVQRIAEQVKALPANELEEFLSWLAEYDKGHCDKWDREIERDSREGGSLSPVLKRARADIASGRTKPLDEVLDNS
jgi:hypothetical protein